MSQGFDNKTLEVDRGIWDLSRLARQSEEVRAIIEGRANNIMAAFASAKGGPQFLDVLNDFLNGHGKRGAMCGICHTSWLEDPCPVLQTVRDYLWQEGDPTEELQQRAAERVAAITDVRERLQGYPSNVRDEFEALLKRRSSVRVSNAMPFCSAPFTATVKWRPKPRWASLSRLSTQPSGENSTLATDRDCRSPIRSGG